MSEVRPAADQPPADDARRAALMLATLGFAALPRVPTDIAPTLQALHRWLDSWRGIGDLVRIFGMILVTVGAAIIVVFGVLTAGTLPGVDPVKEFIVALVFGGPIAALGLILVAIRKPEKRGTK